MLLRGEENHIRSPSPPFVSSNVPTGAPSTLPSSVLVTSPCAGLRNIPGLYSVGGVESDSGDCSLPLSGCGEPDAGGGVGDSPWPFALALASSATSKAAQSRLFR